MALLICMISFAGMAQTPDLPFRVSNPKHKKWPVDEAERIYFAACDRVALKNSVFVRLCHVVLESALF